MPKCVVGRSSSAWHWFRHLGVAAAIALGVLSLSASTGTPQKQDRRKQIDKLEDAWRSAVLSSNIKALDALLADDYMAIEPSGTIQTKEDTLQSFRTGRVHFDLLNISDRKVRFYGGGGTAVVTSLAEIQAKTADGSVAGSYRYTRVYVRNVQGQWKIVSFEASRIQETASRKKNEAH